MGLYFDSFGIKMMELAIMFSTTHFIVLEYASFLCIERHAGHKNDLSKDLPEDRRVASSTPTSSAFLERKPGSRTEIHFENPPEPIDLEINSEKYSLGPAVAILHVGIWLIIGMAGEKYLRGWFWSSLHEAVGVAFGFRFRFKCEYIIHTNFEGEFHVRR